ncbi:hypothetical protein IE81DRAFT_154475 [Ceraceosorus guamensis]|uniref:Uncharacterized protein n=1 Tax=Ceraceosorus guamensis TaxID=1522189 RepID=A0A316VWV9_9BASI|nr:hypothetical protein IE81DRAFT_154475 [Ceraceosorus guamensis]PWN41794.1 hypothetical protein IE81DRAFT_154475 [Ceraceosorus guamensis]
MQSTSQFVCLQGVVLLSTQSPQRTGECFSARGVDELVSQRIRMRDVVCCLCERVSSRGRASAGVRRYLPAWPLLASIANHES